MAPSLSNNKFVGRNLEKLHTYTYFQYLKVLMSVGYFAHAMVQKKLSIVNLSKNLDCTKVCYDDNSSLNLNKTFLLLV